MSHESLKRGESGAGQVGETTVFFQTMIQRQVERGEAAAAVPHPATTPQARRQDLEYLRSLQMRSQYRSAARARDFAADTSSKASGSEGLVPS